MKLTVLLTCVLSFQAFAGALAQKVNIQANNTSLKTVIQQLQRQSGYSFVLDERYLAQSKRITLSLSGVEVLEALPKVFANQPFGYQVEGKVVYFAPRADAVSVNRAIEQREQQQRTVSGRVTDGEGNPLEGVTVRVNGTNVATTTDGNGRYELRIPDEGSTLTYSNIGFTSVERPIGSQSVLDVSMEASVSDLDEVVVVGYGVQRRETLTSAVSTLEGSTITKQPVADMASTIAGRVPGVLYTQGSGQAGNDHPRIFIRGISSIGNTNPLVIVDGVPRNFSQLSPNEIESITILKDAAAVAPYGIGGANGVVLITTKKGNVGKPQFTFDAYTGRQTPTALPNQVDAVEYLTMKRIAATNEGMPDPYPDKLIEKYRSQEDPDRYPNSNALKEVMDHYEPMSSLNLSLSGGADNIRYNVNAGHFNQKGMIPGERFTRYNLSSNMTAQVAKTTEIYLSLNGRMENRHTSGIGFDIGNLMENLLGTTAIMPFLYSNGLPTALYASIYNDPSYQKRDGKALLTQLSVRQELPFLDGLSLKVVGSYDFNPFEGVDPVANPGGLMTSARAWFQGSEFYVADTTKTPLEYVNVLPSTRPSFYKHWSETIATTLQAYLEYSKRFAKHDVSALMVFEDRVIKHEYFTAGRINYQTGIQELFAGSSNAADLSNDGSSSQAKQRSVVYRAHYGFADKYLFEATGRYDGHYYFAPGNRFGFFPAFSIAWRLSEENFMKDGIARVVNDAKIRASAGESGGLAGIPFQYQSTYNLYGNSAILGSVLTQGLYESTEANPNITWERARKYNVGVDIGLLQNRLRLTGDYFFEKRSGMLVSPNITVPSEYGIGLSQVNAGKMENRGFEIEANYVERFSPDLVLSVNANFTYSKNRLTQVFENAATYDFANRRRTGRPLGTQFGLESLGYFTADDFNADGSLRDDLPRQPFSPRLYPGDIRYADISGPDGIPDGVIDYHDEIPMGPPALNPGIVYGVTPTLTYKGFELSLTFQGAGNRSTQISHEAAWPFFNGKNALRSHMSYWTPENPHAENPRLTSVPSVNNTQASTFWQRDISYLRLRTGLLAYNLPNSFLEKGRLTMAKVYLSGNNLLTLSRFENFDPEMVQGRGWYYPILKTYTFGINIGF